MRRQRKGRVNGKGKRETEDKGVEESGHLRRKEEGQGKTEKEREADNKR